MKLSRANLLSLGFVIAAFALAGALYTRLPESVPTHWNWRGQVDDSTPKPWGPFVLSLTMLGVYLLFVVIPRISPRGYRIERFRSAFETIQTAVMGYLFLFTCIILLAAVGVPIPMDRTPYAGVGLLFIVLGNLLGKVTKNFFVGIRTPWTLASDEVWHRTHRLAGLLFVLGGLVLLISGLAGGGVIPVITITIIAALVPAIYSLIIYRRIEGFHDNPS